jgi:hypothetical protein
MVSEFLLMQRKFMDKANVVGTFDDLRDALRRAGNLIVADDADENYIWVVPLNDAAKTEYAKYKSLLTL